MADARDGRFSPAADDEDDAPRPRLGVPQAAVPVAAPRGAERAPAADDGDARIEPAPVNAPQSPAAVAPTGPDFARAWAEEADRARGDVAQQGALGRPTVHAEDFEELEDEASKLHQRDLDFAEAEAMAAGAMWEAPPEAPGFLNRPLIRWLAMLFGASMVAFLANQIFILVREIQGLPIPFRWVGWGCFSVVALVFLAACVRLTWMYMRYRVALRLPSLNAVLTQRSYIRREQAMQHVQTLREKLLPFVAGYEIEKPKARQELKRLGASEPMLAALSNCREQLMRGARGGDRAWVEQFQSQFLKPLDDLAAKRVAGAGWRVFRLTGISQRAGLDAIIILFASVDLMGDLCRIYGVRANRSDSFRLLLHVLTNAAIAAQAEQMVDHATDFGADAAAHAAGHVFEVLAKVLAKLAGSIADASINKILIARLGKRAMRALRPFRDGPEFPASRP